MRSVLLSILVVLLAAESTRAEGVPKPSVTRIDYSQPEKYLVLHESFGTESRIRAVAAKLKAETPDKTLAAINNWIGKNLKYDDSVAYAWRNFDTAVDTGMLGSCADHALVFAALARACGIPAVFVKTMDVPWIYEFRTTGTCQTWSGHMFLELHLDGRWQLLDAQAMTLYDDYSPAQRILPGNRLAYDKGSDPHELVLSLDWERWKQQTAAYFSEFDLSELPVGPGRHIASPDDVFIAADSPIWQALTDRCQSLGYQVRQSFNTDFDRCLAMAKGSRLITVCVGQRIVLPEERYSEFLPLAADELRKKTAAGEKGVLTRRLDDGTTVYLLYAKDVEAMLELVQRLRSEFDLSELPVGPGRHIASPDDVYITADSPIWQALTERCRSLGYRVPLSFNTDFDRHLPAAKGSRLIITCVGQHIVLPEERYSEFLPLAADQLRKKTAAGEKGMLTRRLDDGTTVYLLYAKDVAAMLELVQTLTLPAES